jgi:predicted RNA-binding Zn ribbon-like protein
MTDLRSPALFVADALALDFLNSVATPADEPVDWIADGDGFLAWLAQSGLAPANETKALRKRSTPRELDAAAAKARDLREWFRSFVTKHKGRPLRADALRQLGPLNRLLEADEKYSQIVEQGGATLRLRSMRRWRAPDALLSPIGEALARFVCEEEFADVKVCERPGCTLLFADHTRGRARRWCSMALCGNRAKQAALRQRRKAMAQEAKS